MGGGFGVRGKERGQSLRRSLKRSTHSQFYAAARRKGA